MKMPRSSCQAGFAIVSAIFLLVILSLLGAYMLSTSSSQQIGSAQNYMGSSAYWAAKGGMQWAIAKVQPPATSCPPSPTILSLNGFAVTVSCTSHTYTEGADSKTIYWIGSTAAGGGAVGSVGYTERSLNAFVEF